MNAPIYTRGQIFVAGVRLALAAALVVGGFHLVFGGNVLRSAGYVVGTFAGISILAWMAELFLGSAYERVTTDQATHYKRAYAPVGGAAFASAQPLLGGPNAPETLSGFSVGGSTRGLKGRALDFTLPEERVAAPDPLAAMHQPAGAIAASPPPAAPTAGVPSSAPALPANDADGDFQDLSSLLRGSATAAAAPAPSPVAGGALR